MSTLADAIERDRLKERPQTAQAPTCFVCGRSYSIGDGRFCSLRCRDGFDAGLPPYEAQRERYSLPVRGDGSLIDCKGCRKPFVSKGLRCCASRNTGSVRKLKLFRPRSAWRCCPSGLLPASNVAFPSPAGATVRRCQRTPGSALENVPIRPPGYLGRPSRICGLVCLRNPRQMGLL
jgi:hypothetical protein